MRSSWSCRSSGVGSLFFFKQKTAYEIRVAIPQLTEERRRDLVKQAKAKGEDARVSVRNIRRKAMEELHRIRKDGEAGEDEVARAEKDLDKTTHQYVTQID